MNRFAAVLTLAALCIVAVGWPIPVQAQAAAVPIGRVPLVAHLIDLAGRANGVCFVPRGGRLALDIANNSAFLVVSQEPNAERTAAMRAKADEAGLLGRRVYIAQADANDPVLADNYANVVVITDATDELLDKLDPAAILKVIAAHGGKAIVGLATGAQGTLTPAKLTSWANSFGVPDAKIVQDAFGLWAIITKPQLPGAAEWTHRFFDAGFNPVSNDTAFTLPSMTQWLDTPYNHGAGAPRIAGGKLLSVMEGQYESRPQCEVNYLVMRDAYNGVVLWKRDMGVKYAADYYLSSVVMTSDAVYVIDLPNPTILVLNPDTGAEMRKIDCSALGKQVKWIALQSGVLFAGAGNTDHTGGPWGGVFGAQHVKFLRQDEAALQDHIATGNCGAMGAYDAATGKPLWSHREDIDCIPEFLIAMLNHRLFYLAQDHYVACLDAQTGAVIWKNPEAAKAYKDNLYAQFAVGSGALEAANGTLLFAAPGSARIALNAADGKMLWVAPKYGGHQLCGSLIWGNYVLGQKSVDLRTGALKWDSVKGGNPYRDVCTFTCATQRYITGMTGPAFDLTTMTPVSRPSYLHKSPCSMGSVVGEGVLFQSSFHCTCPYQLDGNIVEMSGDARQYQKPAVESERLVRNARPNPEPPLVQTAGDWPVYRGNNDRSNYSAAKVPLTAAQIWNVVPSNPYVNPVYPSDKSETSFEPCQPIAVANLVVTSGPDGAVRTYDAASGKPVWTYYTGAQIRQSPAVAVGRAYVPSGDGFLYCLDAGTGRELWRFRAAPAERRMMVYGHLVSTWPLFAGVLVQDGVVYTAASLLNMDATHVYALEATSGHIIWQNNTSGLPDSRSEDGESAVGTLTVAHGRLWLRAMSFDLKIGECRPNANGILNRMTGVIRGKFLVVGGPRFYDCQSRPAQMGRSEQPVSVVELSPDGTAISPPVDSVKYSEAFAAWDDHQLIATRNTDDITSINGSITHSPILSWDLQKALTLAQTERDERAKITEYMASVRWADRIDSANSWEHIQSLPMHQWLMDTQRVYAVALAPNAVVAAYGMMDGRDNLRRGDNVVPTMWFVSALDRATGKQLWKLPLPSEPVVDGMCITRTGSVVVQLLDGSVVCVGAANG